MDLDVKYYPLVGLNGRMVYIFKLASGQNGWDAKEIAEKARSTLKAGDYTPDIVVMEGEPSDNPRLFGSTSCVSYIRSILQMLANSAWHPAVLN